MFAYAGNNVSMQNTSPGIPKDVRCSSIIIFSEMCCTGSAIFLVGCVLSVNNNGLLNGVMDRDSTEYSSHALANAANKEISNDWILVTGYRNGK